MPRISVHTTESLPQAAFPIVSVWGRKAPITSSA